MNLAIVTPAFNRLNQLKRLYNSLEEQTDKNFTWIVIDDGSTDKTFEFIGDLSPSFNVKYHKKTNEGKVKALNYCFKNYTEFDFYLVIDSDDFLRKNTVSEVQKELKHNPNEIGAVFFRYYDIVAKKVIGIDKNDYIKEVTLSRLEYESKFDKFDGAIGYFSKVFPKYLYPEVENEKYMGPTVIQFMMSDEYKIKFTNKVIGFAEYQQDGLTSKGRLIRIKNPISMIYYCHYNQMKPLSIFTRLKYGVMANAYSFFVDDKSKISSHLMLPLFLKPFGWILYKYWNYKYC